MADMTTEAAKAEKPPAPQAKSTRDVYFVNPVVDVLIAGGGLSIIFFAVLWFVGFGPWTPTAYQVPAWAATGAYMLSFVVNYPHFAATNFRLYQSFDRMMQFPKTSFLSPVVVIAGMAWALVDPSFASWYCKVFLTWSSYHFCAQTKGIALLYARRLGIQIDSFSRWLIVIGAHAPWAFGVLRTETFNNNPFYGIALPRGIPWFKAGQLTALAMPFEWNDGVMWCANRIFYAGCVALLLLVVRTAVKQRRMLPLAALVPVLAQQLWFGPLGSGSAAFNYFVPFFHSLQYMIIAWVFQLKEESARQAFLPGMEAVAWESVKWFAWVVAGGVTLFILWPHALAWRGYGLDHALGCVNAAIQIHHFFVDGVIWKIRDPRTRAMLAGNVLDLAGISRVPQAIPV